MACLQAGVQKSWVAVTALVSELVCHTSACINLRETCALTQVCDAADARMSVGLNSGIQLLAGSETT
eukprot:6187674-Pleurochrysis_carterae.AAC.1